MTPTEVERISNCETEIKNLKENDEKIWTQVSNHIPTAIDKVDCKVDRLQWFIAIGFIAATCLQVILKKYL